LLYGLYFLELLQEYFKAEKIFKFGEQTEKNKNIGNYYYAQSIAIMLVSIKGSEA